MDTLLSSVCCLIIHRLFSEGEGRSQDADVPYRAAAVYTHKYQHCKIGTSFKADVCMYNLKHVSFLCMSYVLYISHLRDEVYGGVGITEAIHLIQQYCNTLSGLDNKYV